MLSDENKYLDRVFNKNNYNTDFIRRNTHRAIDTTETNRDSTSVTTTAAIPYIKGTSEAIARILQPYNIRVAHRPITTLRHLLTNVKDKDEPNNRQGAIYKIECSDCQASYIGETTTLHLTLKMTTAQVVETSVTNNSSFQNYTHPDDHTTRTTDKLCLHIRNDVSSTVDNKQNAINFTKFSSQL